MRRHVFAAGLLSLLPVAAAAEMTCRFTVECFETEACSQTDYSLDLSSADGRWQIESVAGSVMLDDSGPTEGGMHLMVGHEAGARHILALGATGAARYVSVIEDGPMIVTYHGTCTEAG